MTDGTFNKCDRRQQGGLDLTTATITYFNRILTYYNIVFLKQYVLKTCETQ